MTLENPRSFQFGSRMPLILGGQLDACLTNKSVCHSYTKILLIFVGLVKRKVGKVTVGKIAARKMTWHQEGARYVGSEETPRNLLCLKCFQLV